MEEITLPKLTMKTEEFRNGGMDAPIEVEMSMEKLECDFTLTRYDRNALGLFGLAPGNLIPLAVRGMIVSENGEELPAVLNLQGTVREMDSGTWKTGEKATLKLMIALRYYKLTHGDIVVHETDVTKKPA